jgi:predicted TIM-barrel fold metal-dependent hydrolase
VVYQIARYPNVYGDTSAVRRFDYIVEAVKIAGPRKLIFGSDGPWIHPELEMRKVQLLNLPKPAEALVLGGNLQRLMAQVHVGEAAEDIARRAGDRITRKFAGEQGTFPDPDHSANPVHFSEFRL